MSPLGQCTHTGQYCCFHYGEFHELDNQVATNASLTLSNTLYNVIFKQCWSFFLYLSCNNSSTHG